MQKSYKVEFTTSTKHVFSVKANNEEEARTLATAYHKEAEEIGTLHYHEYGDEETSITTVYDVTGTDDELNN